MLALVAAMLLAQCATGINDGPQTVCGAKSFSTQVEAQEGVYLNGPYAYVQSGGGRMLYMRESLAGNSTSPSFYLDTLYERTAGELLRVSNHGVAVLIVYPDGTIATTGPISFFGGHSGEYSILARNGGYLPIGGRMPPNYWGHHGAVQVGNETRMTAGFPFEVYNALSSNGAATDHIFFIDYRGGIAGQGDVRSFNLPVCDGADVNPNPDEPSNRYSNSPPLGCVPGPNSLLPDGSYGKCNDWYVATDAGHAMPGTIYPWVSDVGEGCQCVPALFDGGLTSSYRKLSDRSECRP